MLKSYAIWGSGQLIRRPDRGEGALVYRSIGWKPWTLGNLAILTGR